MSGSTVLKLGGELVEDQARREAVAAAVARGRAASETPLVIVHGGGRDIDAALKAAGIPKRQVDGLRITDAATLDIVVGVLAGRINTSFVAALNAAGVPAVGLTGADARVGLSSKAAAHRSTAGEIVDLELVGEPNPQSDRRLVDTLIAAGYVPVIASIGSTTAGELLNVNADTLAAHVAATIGAERLVIAGGTAGVLDGAGRLLPLLDADALATLVGDGTATAGMIAKLRACERAIAAGVDDVLIIDGRDSNAIIQSLAGSGPAASTGNGTRIMAAPAARR